MCMWTAEERKAERKKFYNALRADKSLDYAISTEQSLYVEQLHGATQVVDELLNEIDMCDGQGVFLFSGQSGSGKSTELKRLKHRLGESVNVPAVKAYYLDLEDYLNPSEPIDLSSFMLAILVAWLEEIGAQPDTDLFSRLVEYITKTEVSISSLDVKGLKLSLKTDNDFLSQLSSKIQSQQSSFVKWLHEYITQIYQKVCPNHEKCVLLIDSLEKITGTNGINTKEVYQSVLTVFDKYADVLQLPHLHVVYSIPNFVVEQNKQLTNRLGGASLVKLPSIHVFKKKTVEPDDEILAKMCEFVLKRYTHYEQFIGDEVIKLIAIKTGGKLRQFLQALQICLLKNTTDHPINDKNHPILEAVFAQIKPTPDISREIWQWLVDVDNSHTSALKEKIDAYVLEEYLVRQHVLVYLNGESWYGVHPLLRDDLEAFKARQTTQTA